MRAALDACRRQSFRKAAVDPCREPLHKLASTPTSLTLRGSQSSFSSSPASSFRSSSLEPCIVAIMSRVPAPSRALLRRLQGLPCTASQRAGFSTTARHNEEKKDFRGQLQNSIQDRLARERAEQQRMSAERGRASTGQSASLLFGMK